MVEPASMEIVEALHDDSHFTRRVLRCLECGQLYFYEFYEIVDWSGGNDAQYVTYVPVQETDVEALNAADIFELLTYTPRIQKDWPKDAERPVMRWIREH